jgi:hypothetical protein
MFHRRSCHYEDEVRGNLMQAPQFWILCCVEIASWCLDATRNDI